MKSVPLLDDTDRAALHERFGERARFGEPLAPFTWWKIGGPADALVDVTTTDELSFVLRRVLRVAHFDGTCVLTVAGALALASAAYHDFTGTGIGLLVAGAGAIELHGAAMMRHGEIAGTASALLGTNQFLIAAIATTFLGFIDNPALPMALVIAGSAVASTLLNFLTLGPRLERAPQAA